MPLDNELVWTTIISINSLGPIRQCAQLYVLMKCIAQCNGPKLNYELNFSTLLKIVGHTFLNAMDVSSIMVNISSIMVWIFLLKFQVTALLPKMKIVGHVTGKATIWQLRIHLIIEKDQFSSEKSIAHPFWELYWGLPIGTYVSFHLHFSAFLVH